MATFGNDNSDDSIGSPANDSNNHTAPVVLLDIAMLSV